MSRKCRSCSVSIDHRASMAVFCELCASDHRVRSKTFADKCEQCEKAFDGHTHVLKRFCFDCSVKRNQGSVKRYNKTSNRAKRHAAAREITKKAVQVGFLADPKELTCLDCGRPAACYDHRDYNKPLDVEPRCIPCNSSRGAGVAWNGLAKARLKAGTAA